MKESFVKNATACKTSLLIFLVVAGRARASDKVNNQGAAAATVSGNAVE